MRLGIDFGTTRTVVSAAADGRYPVAAFEVDGDYREYLPGLAAPGDDGVWRFGWEAADAVKRGARDAIRSLKRRVGQLAPDQIVAGEATALDLTTGYMTYLRRMLLEHSNLELDPDQPLRATVAVPANASSRQRYLTLEAFGRAGFEVEALVNEPTAAAVEFAHRNLAAISPRSPKRYVVVYDLGGGTFDSSAVSLLERRFELLASEGIGRLGGDDFDQVICELACKMLDTPIGELEPGVLAAALEACRDAKEGLKPTSRKLMVDLTALLPGTEPAVLEVADLAARCAPLIEQSVELLATIFAHLVDHGIDPDNPRELGGIYLVGGGVLFPPVARRLRELYKRKIQLAPQPHAATAVGLAICADPGAGIFVREAVTRHFGVWREGAGGVEKIFDPIISKEMAPPAPGEPLVVHRSYRPHHTIGNLRFMECARLNGEGQPSGDVTPWTRISFPYDPAFADRDDLDAVPVERTETVAGDEIAETYTYNPDGTIAVDIANTTRGYHRHFVLGQLR